MNISCSELLINDSAYPFEGYSSLSLILVFTSSKKVILSVPSGSLVEDPVVALSIRRVLYERPY
jgi:hypothetical protein